MGDHTGLDIAYLSYLRTVQEVHEKKKQLQKCLSDGFFLMSKARYIMGVERVSKLHYSPDMKAKSMVYVKQDDDDNTMFDVSNIKPSNDSSSATDTSTPAGSKTDGVGIRKRKNTAAESVESPVQRGLSELKLSDKGEDIDDAPDPLKWFGVLVPQALRDSQENFTRATVIAGQICTLNEKLKFYEKSIAQLKTSVTEL